MPTEREALFELLVRRVNEARAKGRLQDLLRAIKTEQELPTNTFRVTGTPDQLLESVQTAAAGGRLTDRRLADLVDSIEENGAQHLFLLDLTPAGKAKLTARRFGDAFAEIPARPTPGLYADLPTTTRTHFISRPDALVIKQVFKGESERITRSRLAITRCG
jgi:hypothetical protein